jgi:heat shock protein HspQ
MQSKIARFAIGHVIRHKLFDYRGVIVDVDPVFRGSDDWYDTMAPSRPPKDKPWYTVLMHGTDTSAYVAERNLILDSSREPIQHPDLDLYFVSFHAGVYLARQRGN